MLDAPVTGSQPWGWVGCAVAGGAGFTGRDGVRVGAQDHSGSSSHGCSTTTGSHFPNRLLEELDYADRDEDKTEGQEHDALGRGAAHQGAPRASDLPASAQRRR
jgi:hypothetical protein